jgi:hypothetical protein
MFSALLKDYNFNNSSNKKCYQDVSLAHVS